MVGLWYFFRPHLWGAEAWLRPALWWTASTLLGWAPSRNTSKDLEGSWWIIGILGLVLVSTLLAPFSDASSWEKLLSVTKILAFVFLIIKLCDTPRRLAGFVFGVLLGCLWMSKSILANWDNSLDAIGGGRPLDA